jgi:hypothetical protein
MPDHVLEGAIRFDGGYERGIGAGRVFAEVEVYEHSPFTERAAGTGADE